MKFFQFLSLMRLMYMDTPGASHVADRFQYTGHATERQDRDSVLPCVGEISAVLVRSCVKAMGKFRDDDHLAQF
jgi:hypothetical protein